MKRVWIGLGLVAIVLAIRFTGVADLLSLDTLARHRAALTGWVAANPALSALAYLGALLAALVAAVSTGGLPGSITFLAACVPIANAMGVPIAVLPVLLAVELVPDVFRTLGNVTADLAVTSILSRDRPK